MKNMPVLLKPSEKSMYPAVDVETLVSEVRERLCLKSRDKFCSTRRSAPYHVNKLKCAAVCEHYSCGSKKHYSSPELYIQQKHCKHRLNSYCGSCGHSQPSKVNTETYEDPHVLLEKLLAEQSLIQEAVRRLQSQIISKSFTPHPTGKLFHLVDDDSCDQFSNQTPSYSESEDDSVSQHSLDL